jgi:uncharacterized protein (DUF433 family)
VIDRDLQSDDQLTERGLVSTVPFMIFRVIARDPAVLGGMPVFSGTRVLARTFLDCLEAGYSIDDFLEDFPSVRHEQAVRLLEEAREQMELAAPPPRHRQSDALQR